MDLWDEDQFNWMPSWLRYVLAFPVSFIAMMLVYNIFKLIGWISVGSVSPFLLFGGTLISAHVMVDTFAKFIPKHHENAALGCLILTILFVGTMILSMILFGTEWQSTVEMVAFVIGSIWGYLSIKKDFAK